MALGCGLVVVYGNDKVQPGEGPDYERKAGMVGCYRWEVLRRLTKCDGRNDCATSRGSCVYSAMVKESKR